MFRYYYKFPIPGYIPHHATCIAHTLPATRVRDGHLTIDINQPIDFTNGNGRLLKQKKSPHPGEGDAGVAHLWVWVLGGVMGMVYGILACRAIQREASYLQWLWL